MTDTFMPRIKRPLFPMIGAAALALVCTAAVGQTPSGDQSTDPNSASSPHQRTVTKTPATEAPAQSGASPNDASTAHQKAAVKKTGKKSKAKKNAPPTPP
jgi:hypothetical protein